MTKNLVKMKTLIVDDKLENLYLLEALLRRSGYETVSANNGAEAYELAENDNFNLIISDILMPVMDGFTLCRKCKKNDKLKNIPFIFYTATYTDAKDEEFALKLGADKFLIKPQDPDVFLNIIKDLFDKIKQNEFKPREVSNLSEEIMLTEYNYALIRKLEDKMNQTEENEKSLKEYVIKLEKSLEEKRIAEEKIIKMNAELEQIIEKKTMELQKRVSELQHFHDVTIEREIRMQEMKAEIKRLKGNNE